MKTNYLRLMMGIVSICFFNTLTWGQKGLTIEGKIQDADSQQPIPYATVKIVNAIDSAVVGGTTTNDSGQFELQVKVPNFFLELSFIGYFKDTISEFPSENGYVDLGTIYLNKSVQELDGVNIQAEKSTVEFQLDKKVFNVGKDLSSTGASALEVLNNVPSVNVSIEGEINLRGASGAQILINGKPSVIAGEQGNALGTITADMIERIEVITNPSAKYDAEGTAGIINIVLKKEEKKGLNGSISLNTGAPHNHSLGLSLNYRTEKFNLFSQLGAGYRSMPRYSENISTDLINNTSVISDGLNYRNENFYNLNLGTDYHINDRNVLTLSGSVALELEQQPSTTNFSFQDSTGNIVSTWQRTETTEAVNPKYQYDLIYKSTFKDNKEHTLLMSAQGNFFGKDQSSEFFNRIVSGSDDNSQQRTSTNFQERKQTFSVDYIKPFKKNFKLEAGSQYVIQDVSNDYAVSDFVNGEWVQDLGLTNVFDYNQNVLGLYATGAYEGKKYGLKMGLRAENTDLLTVLKTTNEKNDVNYSNLFPSVHTSYKINKRFSLQAGYSKRIYRPRLWDLNPFFNISNTYNIRTGNPNLMPEFTDSYELSSIFIFKKMSLNVNAFQLYTTDVVERIASFENNVTTTMPENVGTKRSTGLEMNMKYTPWKKLDIQGDVNYSYFKRDGELNGTVFDFNASQWSTKWTAKVKLPHNFDLEVTGNYQSKYQTVQGNVSDMLFMDAGVRKKLKKGKAVFSLSVRDVFASRIRTVETFQGNFYNFSESYRGRFITLGFSYGFGKGEAMQYTGGRR
ncbi:Outer membrane receptor proteins, mostly Fe transport [Lishizhenia tianjinensis]|uniref:Outer membrane receptor proteins, mostly Fe transport n=1 Tax=Lishizhenia tianjinensis TaxID=477690 RepID=A0A1I6ZLW5_9FLAO|nr:outer membrane beta-barrel family protein [Lishizhenia tianjinensis]SFT63575.1 Outer membrane receptor proteins, mostly Fe transport [Lishizhenia tianjinensis]